MRSEYEARGVGFLAVSMEPDVELTRRGAAKHGVAMTVAITEDEVLAPLGVRGVPSTVFLDASGKIVAAASGERDRAFLRRRVEALLDLGASAAR